MAKYNVFDCTLVELDKHHSDRMGNLTVVENGRYMRMVRQYSEEIIGF